MRSKTLAVLTALGLLAGCSSLSSAAPVRARHGAKASSTDPGGGRAPRPATTVPAPANPRNLALRHHARQQCSGPVHARH